jgi:hypothetical protein
MYFQGEIMEYHEIKVMKIAIGLCSVMAVGPLVAASGFATDRIHIVASPENSGKLANGSSKMEIIVGLVDNKHSITITNKDTGIVEKGASAVWSTIGSYRTYLLPEGRWTVSFNNDTDSAMIIFPEDEGTYKFEPGKITPVNEHRVGSKFNYEIVNKSKARTRSDCLVLLPKASPGSDDGALDD